MFTGLIESVGRVAGVERSASGVRLTIRTSLAREVGPGDSIAVNGVCLTVVTQDADTFTADIGPETMRVTTLGSAAADQDVNLERAMRADGRFGGHFVQGHVDATGTVAAIRHDGDATWLTIGFDGSLSPYMIAKGSIAVDGVSLTIARLAAAQFDVMLIPFTLAHTSLRSLRTGGRVNLECDMVGKYVARAVAVAEPGRI